MPYSLLLSASQSSYLAVLDPTSSSTVPRWYTGNIYGYSDAPAIRIPLRDIILAAEQRKTPLSDPLLEESMFNSSHGIQLDLLMSLDYEIRLFGDPTVSKNDTIPTIQAELKAAIEPKNSLEQSAVKDEQHMQPEIKQSLMSIADAALQEPAPCTLIGNPGSHIVPHFVDGWAYGNVIGMEVTSCSRYYLTIYKVTAGFIDGDPLNVCPLSYYTK